MSAYIKLSTLEYPRHQGDIRLEHPEIGDEFVCPNTYAEVLWADAPEINHESQICYEIAPQLKGKQWIMVWEVRDLTEQEKIEKIEFNKKAISFYQQDLTASGTPPNVI
jgi:hypothetical protein